MTDTYTLSAGKHLTDTDRAVVKTFLAVPGIMVPSETNPQYKRCTLTDAEVARRINAMYAGTAILSREVSENQVRRLREEVHGLSYERKKPEASPEASEPAMRLLPAPAEFAFVSLSQALAEHRANTADSLEEAHKKLDTLTKIVLALAKEWKIA